jgi:RNA 3'-terminal phosphate cyclase (ATP)
MITIDGSQGEGGGQVIRTSLALSMITGKAFEVRNVRGRRKNAGLARQHLTCVLAAKKICGAEVVGAQLKSSHIKFEPGTIVPGEYHFPIGTAGSTSLVAQTVLPALLTCETASQVTVEGGTHNRMAPPFDFLKLTYLPLLNQMGPTVEATLDSYGFYPAGGGKISLQIQPGQRWKGLKLLERGTAKPFVKAIVSDLPETIGERECSTICRKANWPRKDSEVVTVEKPRGPGNVVLIQLASKEVTEVFSGVGEVGIRAEQVARKVLKAARNYLGAEVPVGPHLADQLMLPAAIAAMKGEATVFKTMALTQHSQTHVDIISRFLDVKIETKESGDSNVEVQISP